MKTKENKIQNTVTKSEPQTLDQWWATQSHNQKMMAFTIFQLMDQLNEKRDRRMEIRLDQGKIKVALTTPISAGAEVDDVVSFHKPVEPKKVSVCPKVEAWFRTLMDQEPELAAQVREAVLGNPSKWRWN